MDRVFRVAVNSHWRPRLVHFYRWIGGWIVMDRDGSCVQGCSKFLLAPTPCAFPPMDRRWIGMDRDGSCVQGCRSTPALLILSGGRDQNVKTKARRSTGRSNVKRKPAPVCLRLVQVPLDIWTSPKITSACMARLESVARAPPQRPEPPLKF